MVAAWTTKLPFMLKNWHSFPVLHIHQFYYVCIHMLKQALTLDSVCEREFGYVCMCLWWLLLSVSCYWLYHWVCSNPFLCLCLTDLPVYTATVHAAAAVSQGSSSLRSGSLALHTLTESAGHPSEDNRREDEQETDFKTEEGDKLSDIMSTKQMSIKER